MLPYVAALNNGVSKWHGKCAAAACGWLATCAWRRAESRHGDGDVIPYTALLFPHAAAVIPAARHRRHPRAGGDPRLSFARNYGTTLGPRLRGDDGGGSAWAAAARGRRWWWRGDASGDAWAALEDGALRSMHFHNVPTQKDVESSITFVAAPTVPMAPIILFPWPGDCTWPGKSLNQLEESTCYSSSGSSSAVSWVGSQAWS
ncbi:hypothetical protein F0185_12400 [Massilia sp. CCM 8692]|uniref:Uncharacterized protein n=1 Tax=Massilia rubra TaxID=2607910 RepID=A0ABX0LSG0_9BURK|nr:hypothetical protein [Massilia rubra]